MSIRKKVVIRISLHVKSGAGYCSINIKDNPKVYQVNTPVHSILDNEQAARLLFMQVMKQFFDGEFKHDEEEAKKVD